MLNKKPKVSNKFQGSGENLKEMNKKLQPKTYRSPEQREQDLIFIAPLLVNGCPIWQITEKIAAERDYHINRDMVSYDIRQLLKDWKKRHAKTIDTHKSLMIERAEKMWFIACENYELSKQGKTKTVQKQKKYKGRAKVDSQGKEIKSDDLIVSEQQKHHTDSIGDIAWFHAMKDAWNLLSEALDLKGGKRGGGIPEAGTTAPAAVIQLHFHTKTRNSNNDQYQDAEELDDNRPEETPGSNLLVS